MSTAHCLSGLRSVRRYRGFTLEDAAHIIGVKSTSYSRIEAGTRRTYFDKICALADALGCSVDDLRVERTDDELLQRLGPNPLRVAAPPTPAPPPPPANLDPDGTVVERALAGWETGE